MNQAPIKTRRFGPVTLRCGVVCGVMCLVIMAPTTVKPDFDTHGVRYAKRDILRAIEWYAKRYRVDPLLLRAVVKAESDFRHDARSHKGAMGLMQLMPSTIASYEVSDPFDPLQNIRAGARRMRHLLHLYHGNITLALAAYNAGVHRVRGHRVPRIRETRRYVRKVLGYYHELQQEQRPLGPSRLRPAPGRGKRHSRKVAAQR